MIGPEVIAAAGAFVGAAIYNVWKSYRAEKHGRVTANAAVATVEALARVEGAIGAVNANLGALTREVAGHGIRLERAERRLGLSWTPTGNDAAAPDA